MQLDVMAALRELVLATPEIMAVLAESDGPGIPPAPDRVYVNRIPREDIEASDTFHPPKMLVIRQAGGLGKRDYLPIDHPVITALCYGESDLEADRLRRAVWSRFVYMHNEHSLTGGACIFDINPNGGPIPLVDPDIVWPAVSQSFTVMAEAQEVA